MLDGIPPASLSDGWYSYCQKMVAIGFTGAIIFPCLRIWLGCITPQKSFPLDFYWRDGDNRSCACYNIYGVVNLTDNWIYSRRCPRVLNYVFIHQALRVWLPISFKWLTITFMAKCFVWRVFQLRNIQYSIKRRCIGVFGEEGLLHYSTHTTFSMARVCDFLLKSCWSLSYSVKTVQFNMLTPDTTSIHSNRIYALANVYWDGMPGQWSKNIEVCSY